MSIEKIMQYIMLILAFITIMQTAFITGELKGYAECSRIITERNIEKEINK